MSYVRSRYHVRALSREVKCGEAKKTCRHKAVFNMSTKKSQYTACCSKDSLIFSLSVGKEVVFLTFSLGYILNDNKRTCQKQK
jgi:hypothetical protein